MEETDDAAPLGPKLRQLRQRQGFSQRELARRAGVTNATVSQIEQDRVSPSIASLRKIVGALDLSLATFFAGADEPEPSPFQRGPELAEMGAGGVSLRLVGPPSGAGRALSMLIERYPPGADTGPTMLSHPGEECGFIIRGQIEVTVGSHTSVLGPGDAYSFSSALPHRFHNVGSESCELVSAASPATF